MAWQAARLLSRSQATRATSGSARCLACSPVLRLRSEAYVQDHLFRHRSQDDNLHKAKRSAAAAARRNRPAVELTEEQRAIINSVKQCTQDLDWQGALAIYQQFPAESGEGWLACHRAVLHCLCKSLRYEESKTVFDQLPARDIISYNCMLGLLGRLGLLEEADELLQRLDSEGIARNGITQSQVLTGFATGHRWAEAVELLGNLKSDESLHETTNWEVVYLLSMTACARANQQDKARALLEELRANHEGCVQTTHYNALLVSCGSDGEAADRIFQEMKDVGLTPRGPDWRAYLSCHRDCKEQQLRYQQMRQELPSSSLLETWAVLLRTAILREDLENAEWVVQEMKSNGCELDSDEAQSVPSLRRAIAMYHKRKKHADHMAGSASTRARGVGGVDAAYTLPEGWQSTTDPASGRAYYWHVNNPTGTTTWDRP